MARVKGQAEIEKKNTALGSLTIEYVPVDSINPNDYNPNRQNDHDFELLKRSMTEDGFTQPIICHTSRTIVDGEHRWRAAQALGYKEVPVVFVDMTPEQMKISTLRHNRARGSEDIELTAQVLRDLEQLGALDWAQDSLMLDDVEMNKLLEDVPAPDALAAEEFSTAWEPDKGGGSMLAPEGGDSTEAREIKSSTGDTINTGMSAAAADQVRRREAMLKMAKTAEERQMVAKDSQIFRLSLIFSGEEAPLVKRVLNPKPAEKIVEFCKKYLAENPDE